MNDLEYRKQLAVQRIESHRALFELECVRLKEQNPLTPVIALGRQAFHVVRNAAPGAAASGDIGRHFPDTDPRWEGASSIELLRAVVDLVRSRGFVVVNLDVVVVAERLKIGPHADRMREAMASAVGIEPDAVSITGKTNEGMDATGRGEAIATHAVALLRTL